VRERAGGFPDPDLLVQGLQDVVEEPQEYLLYVFLFQGVAGNDLYIAVDLLS
jgi:hypothetical protein